MHEKTNERISLPPPAMTPMLDLLQKLAQINNVGEFRSPDPLRDNVSPDSWLLPSGANLLWLLTQSLVFGQTDSADFKRVVEALKSFHNALQGDIGTNHAQVHAEFEALEGTLRKQSAAVDRLLGQSASQGTSKPFLHALQQTLFVQCANRGKTAARFRIVNRTGKPSSVDFRASFAAADGVIGAALNFEPNDLHLEPQQAAICSAVIDLSRCPHIANKTLELGADVYLNSKLTLKLFISVEVYGEHA